MPQRSVFSTPPGCATRSLDTGLFCFEWLSGFINNNNSNYYKNKKKWKKNFFDSVIVNIVNNIYK